MSSYVIVDLEMCRVQDEVSYNDIILKNEIIQIGAVRVNENLEIEESFMSYVHPEYGMIDPFIEKLTGITNEDLQNAKSFKDVLNKFTSWLKKEDIIYSWSENDPYQIETELDVKDIYHEKMELYLETWQDAQILFSEKMFTSKIYKLSEALNICGIISKKGAHDALVDAYNTAKLFIKMNKEKTLVLSEYYSKETHGYNPFQSLLFSYK